MKKSVYFYFCCFLLLAGCDGCEDKKLSVWETLPDCTSDVIVTSLPVQENSIYHFIPLGLYNPPGHTFPSDHHYFGTVHGNGNVPVYAACDGWIIFVSRYTSTASPIGTEYAVELAPCNSFKMKYGHISTLEQEIADQLGSPDGGETYSTGGETYSTTTFETRIAVTAGQKIGEVMDVPGISGIDFGSIDLRVTLPFINPARFDNYGYINTVSFLNYTTENIKNILYDLIQFDNQNVPLRTFLPLEGTICYDVQGTVQGLWFLPNTSTVPEDPHLALIKRYCDPERYVFSTGTSLPGLASGPYEFDKTPDGEYNHYGFDEITDNEIYAYSDLKGFWGDPVAEGKVILIQLVDAATLKIEVQNQSDGPEWAFTNNAVIFNR